MERAMIDSGNLKRPALLQHNIKQLYLVVALEKLI